VPTKIATPKASRAALETPKKETAAASKEAGFKIPKDLAECADMLYLKEKERYALQAKAEALKKEETTLREHLINNLPKSKALGVTGKVANAVIKEKDIVELIGTEQERFAKVYDYILKNGRKNPGVWALLQRRLGDATAKEMIDAGKGALIGARLGKVKTISLTKVG
jgi:hypothetical protein